MKSKTFQKGYNQNKTNLFYSLQKKNDVYSKHFVNALEHFYNKLPSKPYVSSNLEFGVRIRPKETAINNRYIQFNTPFEKNIMVFDIDEEDSQLYFIDKNIPKPNLIILNRENGRSHYVYFLNKGVYFTKNSSQKAQNYYNDIYKNLCYSLNADNNYIGLLCKNPFSDYWKTIYLTNHLYTLDELAKFKVDTFNKQIKNNPKNMSCLGRNCSLFECLRFYAYREIRKVNYNYNLFYKHCEDFINNANKKFSIPLFWREVKDILKSVCNWIYKHFSNIGFSNFQKQANKKSQKARKEKANIKRNECLELFNKGYTPKEIIIKTNLKKSSVYSYLKQKPI